jgi:tripartite ATP-independent transporter DctM subunit
MSAMTVGAIGIVLLIVLLFMGVPVGMTMFVVGFFGYVYLLNFNGALGVLKTVFYSQASNYNFTVIPLFVLMGQFIYYAGVSSKLYDTCSAWLGRLPGGLAVATIGACSCFAAICGSSTATAATFSTVSLPEMKKANYNPGLACGCIVAGGTLGILIPPSTGFILYGIITEQSIGKLFAAGILPGIILMLCYMSVVIVSSTMHPDWAPLTAKIKLKQKLKSLVGASPVILLFIVVIGGIFAGIFTPNEGGAIGAFGGFVCLVLSRRLSIKTLYLSLRDSIITTGMIMFIIIGAYVFGYFLALTRIPSNLASWVGTLEVSRYVVLVIILIVYVILGCLMDSLAMILLTVPIFFPVIISLGFNPIWYGVLMVMVQEMGLITPPVGMNIFIVKGMAGDVPIGTIYKGVIPHIIAMVAALAIMVVFPQLSLWIPGILYP